MLSTWIKCSLAGVLCGSSLVISSCGDSGPGERKDAKMPPKQNPYKVYTVEIKEMKFVPDSITVKKGDEVVFVNRDVVAHCVTEEKANAWTSGNLPAGQSYLLVAKENADYYCAIHKVMKGKIKVK